MDRWIRTHVGDVMTSKGDQATLGVGGLRGSLRGISTSSDEHLISPNLSEEVVRVYTIGFLIIDTRNNRFDGVKVSEVGEPFAGLRDKVGEGRFWVFHPHRLPGIPRGDAESDSIFANGVGYGFDDFKWEPGTVLDRSAVFVCSLVGDVLEELIWEVSVGEMELNSVESGLIDGFIGGVGVPLDVCFDLFNCQRTRGWVGRRNGDGGCADKFKAGVLRFK